MVVQGRHKQIVEIKDSTIQALKEQIDAVKENQDICNEERIRLTQTVELMKEALEKSGIHVTLTGRVIEESKKKDAHEK